MVWVDYAIVGVVVLSMLISLFRGFVRECLSLVAWVLAFLVSIRFAGLVSQWLAVWIHSASLRLGVAYAGLFVLVLVVGAVVNYLGGRFVSATGFTGTDRMLGLVFGAARGVAIITLLLLAAGLTSLPHDAWWRHSLLISRMEPMAVWVRDRLPPDLAQRIRFSAGRGVRS